jgi:hypothetical protein
VNVTADAFIALALVWQLSQIKSPFKSTRRYIASVVSLSTILNVGMFYSIIHWLMISTISTGVMTIVVAVSILISFLIDKVSNGELHRNIG